MIVCLAAAAAAPLAALAQNRPAPVWAVDPARAGRDLPPAGRSLFDYVVTREVDGQPVHDVPFPFERLVKRIEARAGCRQPCAKQVLIPLGRSLQRTAASPAFFEFPRVVAAIDADPGAPGAPLLKDRIYLGYQEKSDLVEVISYNEAAGRFEFQVVRDYRAGGAREVVYARRAMCAACHQNLAPIFSRQVWDETNANPRIAALLSRPSVKGGREAERSAAARGGSRPPDKGDRDGAQRAPERGGYQAVPIHRGVDEPAAIDAATDRANLLGVWQLLWRTGCGDGAAGARCRAAVLVAALQYRLTDERAFDERAPAWREDVLPALAGTWSARWPAGLAIPNPDIPNRDPLPPAGARPVVGPAAAHVPAAFEALGARMPLEVWVGPRTPPRTPPLSPAFAGDAAPLDRGAGGVPRRFVAGLGEFAAQADVRALDAALAARERPAVRSLEAPCEVAWTGSGARFRCVGGGGAPLRVAGRLELRGTRVVGGEVGTLEMDGAPALENLAVAGGTFDAGTGRATIAVGNGALRARLADGAAISAITLAWQPPEVRSRGGAREASAIGAVAAIDDFAPVRTAAAALTAENGDDAPFAARPFGRARVLGALFAKLGMPEREWCCEDAARLPPAAVEPAEPAMPVDGAAKPFAAFYPLCASCHATADASPPNFLAGPPERVAASVKHCAPRIYARLASWRVAAPAREKTPMPPPPPSARGEAYDPPPALAGLERIAADFVRAESGAAPKLEALLADGYERLRPCLPG